MKRPLLVLALLLSGGFALADSTTTPSPTPAPTPTPPPAQTCTTLRGAYAWVSIGKTSWTQNSGIWVSKYEQIVNTHTQVPVYQESSAGCTVPAALELNDLTINGSTESIHVYGYIAIQQAHLHSTPNKLFVADYWLSSDSGHSAWVDGYSPDLTTAKMGLSFNREHSNAAASAHDENIEVSVYFDDSSK